MKTTLKTLILTIIILCSTTVWAQTEEEKAAANKIMEKINEALTQGDCDRAQRNYNIWKDLTERTNSSIESKIKQCKTGGNSSTSDEGIVINGIKWATRNVGTTASTFTDKPEDYGGIYTWEKAKTACPKGWRLPTEKELQSLVDAGSNWTTQNGVSGRKFGNSKLFLPAAGHRDNSDGTLGNQGYNGNYWGSTPYGSELAHSLRFHSGDAYAGESFIYRSYGFSVRCVSE